MPPPPPPKKKKKKKARSDRKNKSREFNYSWNSIKKLAKDRQGCRNVADLCATRHVMMNYVSNLFSLDVFVISVLNEVKTIPISQGSNA